MKTYPRCENCSHSKGHPPHYIDNSPLSATDDLPPKQFFTGSMKVADLYPVQQRTSPAIVSEKEQQISSAGGRLDDAIAVDYTHERGHEGEPHPWIADGHHRYEAAKNLAVDEVPVRGYIYYGYTPPAGTHFAN